MSYKYSSLFLLIAVISILLTQCAPVPVAQNPEEAARYAEMTRSQNERIAISIFLIVLGIFSGGATTAWVLKEFMPQMSTGRFIGISFAFLIGGVAALIPGFLVTLYLATSLNMDSSYAFIFGFLVAGLVAGWIGIRIIISIIKGYFLKTRQI